MGGVELLIMLYKIRVERKWNYYKVMLQSKIHNQVYFALINFIIII